MQIVRVMGGLGNQLFAAAFVMALQARGREVSVDLSWYEEHKDHNGYELERVFPLRLDRCPPEAARRLGDVSRDLPARLRRRLFGPRRGHVAEGGPGYDPSCLRVEGEAYFYGFWQSHRYHEGIETRLREAFSLPPELEPEAEALFAETGGRPILGVHVRRGDYLGASGLAGVCDEAYYRRAIARGLELLPDALALFISDDPAWCRDTLAPGLEARVADWNPGSLAWRDLRLMTRCYGLVIANSSFSWWGARLGAPGRPILAPERWFAAGHPDNPDIIPPDWLRVASGGRA